MAVKGSMSPLPVIGMVCGMCLLGFAGFISLSSTGSGDFLAQEGRKLQSYAFGYVTTSRAPSSLDSSDSSSSGSIFEPSKSSSSSSESSEWNYVWPKLGHAMSGSIGPLTASLLLQIIFAVLYSRVVTDPIIASGKLDDRENPPSSGDDFNNGIFECYKDKWVCFQVLCCPMVRVAHTNAVSGVCPFWESIWCWCCCSWMTVNMGPACLLMWWRLRLKGIMKVEDNPLNDFFLTLFCPLISLCQMSSATDTAMNYKISGCCEYTPYSYGGPMDQLQ